MTSEELRVLGVNLATYADLAKERLHQEGLRTEYLEGLLREIATILLVRVPTADEASKLSLAAEMSSNKIDLKRGPSLPFVSFESLPELVREAITIKSAHDNETDRVLSQERATIETEYAALRRVILDLSRQIALVNNTIETRFKRES